MAKLLVIGCGGVAQVAIQKCCQNDGLFTELVLASRTKAKCDALKEKLARKTKTAITTAEVDADNVAQLCVLIRDFRPAAVLNVVIRIRIFPLMLAWRLVWIISIRRTMSVRIPTIRRGARSMKSAARGWVFPLILTIRGSGPMMSASARPV